MDKVLKYGMTVGWTHQIKRGLLHLVLALMTLLVSDLLMPNRRGLNAELIANTFLPIDVPYINSIPLSRRCMPDKPLWPHGKSCVYSVRSRYHWLRKRKDDQGGQTLGGRIKWSRLWKLNIPPKINMFFFGDSYKMHCLTNRIRIKGESSQIRFVVDVMRWKTYTIFFWVVPGQQAFGFFRFLEWRLMSWLILQHPYTGWL